MSHDSHGTYDILSFGSQDTRNIILFHNLHTYDWLYFFDRQGIDEMRSLGSSVYLLQPIEYQEEAKNNPCITLVLVPWVPGQLN
ncbi:MAG: hypothetical protein ACFFEA_03935 [Candidatus Thorarchaeota archaeon]